MIRNSEIKGIIIRVLHSLVQDQSSPCTCQGNLRKHRLVTLGTLVTLVTFNCRILEMAMQEKCTTDCIHGTP